MSDQQTRAAARQPALLESRAEPLCPGDLVDGKYVVTGLIGAGCMGFVFSAVRESLGDEVAIKVLRREFVRDSQLVARFAREASAAVKIKSEHVASVFDVGTLFDGTPFIVMERLHGKDLSRVMAERGALPCNTAVDYILQACEALAIAHAGGIVHRDIKPENLFATRHVQGEDLIKVLDFGISKIALGASTTEERLAMVKTTTAMGSPMYMSPEQIRAAKDVDARADIWAVGCVLYELITGTPAFNAPSLTELCAIILERCPVVLGSFGVHVPPDLEAVILRCLEKDPARRFQNIGELALALAPFAPIRSFVSVDRCCHVVEATDDDRPDAITLSILAPPRPPAGLQRFLAPALGVALACGGCALLFSPHRDLRDAVAARPPAPPAGSGAATLPAAASSMAPPAVESAPMPQGNAPPAQSSEPRAKQAPGKAGQTKTKARQAVSRSGDELDVGF